MDPTPTPPPPLLSVLQLPIAVGGGGVRRGWGGGVRRGGFSLLSVKSDKNKGEQYCS